MPRTPEETITALVGEWEVAVPLVASLTEQEMDAPTRCEGWLVRDVVAHLVGVPAELAAGNVAALGGKEHVEVRRDRTAKDLSDELQDAIAKGGDLLRAIPEEYWDAPSPFPGLTNRQGVDVLVVEACVHADDVRAAVGRASERTPGLLASLEHVADRLAAKGWGPRTLALDGLPEIPVGEGGERLTGDPIAFLLTATGRTDPAPLGLDATVNIYA